MPGRYHVGFGAGEANSGERQEGWQAGQMDTHDRSSLGGRRQGGRAVQSRTLPWWKHCRGKCAPTHLLVDVGCMSFFASVLPFPLNPVSLADSEHLAGRASTGQRQRNSLGNKRL